jgi:hypothetical protein
VAMKDASSSAPTFLPVFPAEAVVALQRELLDTYEKAGHAWLARAKSEAELWSDLSAKLAASRSVPEVLEAYTQSWSEQMKMTAEDGQRLFHDYQQIAQSITRAAYNGRNTA